MSKPSPADYRHLLQVEAAKLASVDPEQLSLEIPHIEGWTVQSVIGHTGWVFRFAQLCLEAEPENPPSRSSVPEPPPGEDVIDWFAVGSKDFQAVLSSVDLDELHPTFTGPQPAAWWLRRISHELSMHRWDVQAASTSPDPIDAGQARDGIDEVLEIFTPQRMQFATLAGNGETVHLHATDIDDGEWMLTYQPESVEWEHGHSKGDVAAKGPVSDLLLLMWGRIPPSRLEVFGDATLLDRWQAAATF